MIACLHQINYLPGLVTIHKLAHSDMYIVFDDVQFPQGKTFTNRNRIKTPRGAQWLTLPIKHQGPQLIKDIKLVEGWEEKHWKNIEANYTKAPFFKSYKDEFKSIYDKKWDSLRDVNVELIKLINKILKIDVAILYSSKLGEKVKNSEGKEKIFQILSAVGADTYITGWGPGSQRYITEKDFEDRNIKLIKQEFKHPVYPQLWQKEFIPNLSIIDYIFNKGGDDFEKDCNH